MLKPVLFTNSRRLAIVLLGAASLPALADTTFRVQQTSRKDAPMDKGQCDIRLRVDGETEVSLRGDVVSVHTVSGRDARNDGSECSQPLPDHDVRGFNFEVKESGNDVHLVAPPSGGNDFQAVIHIHNPAPGEGRYHFHLTWEISAAGIRDERRTGPAGFAWNNATHYKTRGQGQASAGDVRVDLLDVDVNIDLGGKILISFRTTKKQALSFSGVVNAREAGRLRADVVCDGPDWHVQSPCSCRSTMPKTA